MKSYSELCSFKTFEERFEYLKINSGIGIETFGSSRYLNQILYHSGEWKSFRNKVILRDKGRDLGIEGNEIFSEATVHHINPITIDDVINRDPKIFDMENVITTSELTHKAIHYGNLETIPNRLVERKPNDQVPWKIGN